jgi:acetyl esterase/lipase
MLDDRTATRRELDAIAYPLWRNRSNRAGWTWYLGRPAGAPEVPPYAAASRRENVTGLAPAWISAGSIELFYDEVVRYAERLQTAGVPCRLHVARNAPHAFESIAVNTQLSRELFASVYRFLQDTLLL